MRRRSFTRVPVAVIVSAVTAAFALLVSPAGAKPTFRPNHAAPPAGWMSPAAAKPNASLLYVSTWGCNCVNVYDARSYAPVGQIGISGPNGITTGPDGTLWVTATSSVAAFPPGRTKPSLTIPLPADTFPIDVRVSDDGTVIVANFNRATIEFFPKGATRPSRTLDFGTSVSFTGLTLDAAGDLFVSEYLGPEQGRIIEIPAGQSREVRLGAILATPSGLAFDGAGNLLVDDFDDATTYVFAPNRSGPRFDARVTQPFRTIGAVRTTNPTFLTFDCTKQTLYVGNALRAEVDVFRAADGALRTILPAPGGYGTYIGVATSPRAPS